MDSSFDNQFKEIQGLKWLPWVGENYNSLPQQYKMFVIGESHYYDGTEKNLIDINQIDTTREVIEDMAIDRNYYGTKIFPNFHRTLFNNDSFDSKSFWNLIPFYNFIQRPMDTAKGRPTYEDYFNGWKVFFELHKILKPNICLFIGTSYPNSLNHALIDTNLKIDGIKQEDWISNAYAKSTRFHQLNIETEMVFIRHTSQMYPWTKWNEYLNKRLKNQIDWLNKTIK